VSYFYKTKTDVELEQVADAVRKHFPKRRLGLAIDIEGILEDLDLELLPRRGFRRHAEGYLARDPRIVVVDESIFAYMPRARFTLAEEVCHLILEYKLWSGGDLPRGADGHELSETQHVLIEKDASTLASALLLPAPEFVATFNAKLRELEATGAPKFNVLRETVKHVAEVFQVSPSAAGWRARKLRLLSLEMVRALLPKK
jgi:Zn-dependent peptidase ImmA (M78 family)